MDTTSCPDCGRPAEVADRFVLDSTDGPIEHLQVRCVSRHCFVLPASTLERGKTCVHWSSAAADRVTVDWP